MQFLIYFFPVLIGKQIDSPSRSVGEIMRGVILKLPSQAIPK